MTARDGLTAVLDALALPPEARVGARVAKKTFLDNTRFAAADRRALDAGIEELTWVAKLSPATIGVAAGPRYSELHVLSLRVKPAAKLPRVIDLVHRGPAYPVFLATAAADGLVTASAGHVRPAANDSSRVVADEPVVPRFFDAKARDETTVGFLRSLALDAIRPATLDALADAWLDRLGSLDACRLVGGWPARAALGSSAALRELRARHEELSRELDALTRAAKRQRQTNRLVDANLARQRLAAERRAVLRRLAALVNGEAE